MTPFYVDALDALENEPWDHTDEGEWMSEREQDLRNEGEEQ